LLIETYQTCKISKFLAMRFELVTLCLSNIYHFYNISRKPSAILLEFHSKVCTILFNEVHRKVAVDRCLTFPNNNYSAQSSHICYWENNKDFDGYFLYFAKVKYNFNVKYSCIYLAFVLVQSCCFISSKCMEFVNVNISRISNLQMSI